MSKTKAKDEIKLQKKYAKVLVAMAELAAQLKEMDEEFDAPIKCQFENDDLVIQAGSRRFTVKTTDV